MSTIFVILSLVLSVLVGVIVFLSVPTALIGAVQVCCSVFGMIFTFWATVSLLDMFDLL